ncbi:PAS domain-containing protein [Limnoglobus roseus]|uniref:histidine kinase n=1 Tax=Limnoglobus roseus TaxID=2598579 RepID=A0A5C1AFT0_9BACT|nr:PAS domain-containing protein [Limnoglobus roseus]QEL16836.1 PAS domain S-box protein [Limnoglobus roseus]
MTPIVLCVDDEPEVLEAYRVFLNAKYFMVTAGDGRAALSILEKLGPVAVIVSDLNMPGLSGVKLLATVRERYPDTVRILATGQTELAHAVQAVNDGHVFRFLTKPLTNATFTAAVAAAVDQYQLIVSDRRRTESALQASEERYRQLFEANPHSMWVSDAADRRFLAVNDTAVRQYGYTREQFLTRTVASVEALEGHAVPRGVGRVLRRHRMANGIVHDMEVADNPIEFAGRKAYLTLALDVTAQVLVEESLRLRDRAVGAATQGIVITDALHPDNPIIYVSPGFVRLTGYSSAEVVGRNCRFLQGPDTAPEALSQIRNAIRAVRPCTVEVLNYRKDRTPFWNELSFSPVHDDAGRLTNFVAVQSDATGRHALEQQLRQAQKLESIGQLAAGMAHEINTPIQYIGDNTAFLGEAFQSLAEQLSRGRDVPADGSDLKEMLEEVPLAIAQTLEGVRHVSRLVKAMREFAHPGTEEKVAVDLNAVLETVIAVARGEWKYHADLKTDFSLDLPPVRGLPGELNQVFINLVVNAAHAIGSTGRPEKGTITLSTRRDGDDVEARVTDTGCGIAREIRGRVFDPFFTTKPIGQGTGQGLALAHAVVVNRHGGTIGFESEIGRGTTFVVRLPAWKN